MSKVETTANELAFKIGAELEYIFPINNNKWSVFVEPTYQSYNSSGQIHIGDIIGLNPSSGNIVTSPVYQDGKLNYESIELPIGLRHYFFLNEKNKIFINAGIIFSSVINGKINFNDSTSIEIKDDALINYFLGLGYDFNNKLSLEFRYNSPRDLTLFYSGANNFNNASLKLGYNFL